MKAGHGRKERRTAGRRGARAAPAPRRIAVDLAGALRELEALYRRELARLGLRAARLARQRDTPERQRDAPERQRDAPERQRAERPGGARVRAWRREAVEALALALADGVEPPALLRACARRPLARWPEPGALAAEAREGQGAPR